MFDVFIIKYCYDNNLSILSFKEKIWHFINKSKVVPKCNCGVELNFKKQKILWLIY